jgi:hypothetical protein
MFQNPLPGDAGGKKLSISIVNILIEFDRLSCSDVNRETKRQPPALWTRFWGWCWPVNVDEGETDLRSTGPTRRTRASTGGGFKSGQSAFDAHCLPHKSLMLTPRSTMTTFPSGLSNVHGDGLHGFTPHRGHRSGSGSGGADAFKMIGPNVHGFGGQPVGRRPHSGQAPAPLASSKSANRF